jgi:uncharacterized protein YndB with AHSA1/START domain
MARSIILAVQIDAPAADIYRAITTQEGLASFWTSDVTAEPEVGASLRFGFVEAPVDLQMTVTALEPDREVRWACQGPWPNWTGTDVSWTIDATESGEKLVVFRHDGWPDDQPAAEFGSVALTWARILLALDEHVRTGAVAPALG